MCVGMLHKETSLITYQGLVQSMRIKVSPTHCLAGFHKVVFGLTRCFPCLMCARRHVTIEAMLFYVVTMISKALVVR